MSMNDSLAAALSKINNAEKISNPEVELNSSSLLKNVLEILNKHLYIGSYEIIEDSVGKLKVNLIGSINKCGSIKPRFSYSFEESEDIEKRYLPTRGFGVLIVSTSKGLMTIDEAKNNKLGGRVIAYCY
ncbi:MAG: 30S ribosomal protein S8 [Nanobdellota archaeon]